MFLEEVLCEARFESAYSLGPNCSLVIIVRRFRIRTELEAVETEVPTD